MATHHSNLPYRSRAVRALVVLHDQHLRRFLDIWNVAQESAVQLPVTKDPAYESLDTLGRHVFSAARGYLTWMCEVMELPDPRVRPAPDAVVMRKEAAGYMEHVLERWGVALLDVTDDRLDAPEYPSRWKTLYSIDAMLEHAVMHPIRHSFQLEELMKSG
jgi:hypothetical protein